MTVHRMVDSHASGINSSNAQHQIRLGEVESAKIIRKIQLKELVDHAKKCKATNVMIAGDFNESAKSDAAKSFMNET